jgi:hypothetical protein
MQEEIFTSTIPDEDKGAVFRKNRMGDHKLSYNEQINKKSLIIFSVLCIYGKHAK